MATYCLPLRDGSCPEGEGRVGVRPPTTTQTAIDWHILGVRQLAKGDPRAAEQSFTHELELATEGAKLTGLETGTKLPALKTEIALSSGKAAAYNNRGVARFLLGRFKESLEDFDQAAVLDGQWGVPWVNGAIANLELGQLDQSEKSARMAISLGEKSARVYTVLAEIELKSGLAQRAEDDVKQALDLDPTYPYALLARAEIKQRQGRSREFERSLVQALAGGAPVAADSQLTPSTGKGNALGGSFQESHIKLSQHGFSASGTGFRLNFQDDRQNIEGRSNADQQLTFGELVYSSGLGTIYTTHRSSGGGRPGATTSLVGITPKPGARFDLRDTQALYLKVIPLSAKSNLWLHGSYRDTSVSEHLDTDSSSFYPLRDHQILGEMRLDFDTRTSVGYATTQIDRTGLGGTPIEPAEQLLPVGRTKAWTAYGLHTVSLGKKIDLTLGAMAGGAAGTAQVQPVADLAFKISPQHAIHMRVTPRINNAVSNLVPLDSLAENAQANLVDRQDWTTCVFGRYSTLDGPRTRALDFELSFAEVDEAKQKFETVLFHRSMRDINAEGADPRVATALQFTPITDGEATGIEQRARYDLGGNFTFRVTGTLQSSRATFTNTTYDATAYPTLSQIPVNEMPNFPRLQGTMRLDYASGPWFGGLELNYVGIRKTSLPGTSGGQDVSYVQTSPASAGVHLVLNRRLSQNSSFTLMVFNIGKAHFYPGYPGTTTGVFSYDYKF